MVRKLIAALRERGVDYVVAPYEADAQLAFLSRTGSVDLVVSEDSDCLVFGCKRVLFKLDSDGTGQEIQLRHLGANEGLSLLNWTEVRAARSLVHARTTCARVDRTGHVPRHVHACWV